MSLSNSLNKTLACFCDYGSVEGVGHVARCLPVLQQLQQLGLNTVLLLSAPNAHIQQQADALSIPIMALAITGEQTLADALLAHIEQHELRGIMVDSYAFNALPESTREHFYRSAKKQHCDVSLYDDIQADEAFFADILVNAFIDAESLNYKAAAPKTRCLLGLHYAVIRQSLRIAKARRRHVSPYIFVNFGGSDPSQLTLPVVEALATHQRDIQTASFGVKVVQGPEATQIDEVAAVCKQAGFAHYHAPANFETMLSEATLALAAPGGSIYELAFCSVPSVFLIAADNQRFSANAHADAQWCEAYDWCASESQAVIEQAVERVCYWMQKSHLLDAKRGVAAALIDGYGADRIAKEIMTYGVA